jgi:sortase B
VSDTDEDAWKREFSEEEYGAWLEMLLKKSRFSSDVAPAEADRILTLSTCSYEFEDARFVLHGVLEEQICK